jgi:ubiquinone/menaquinone biosynthesis C-methylase UbiE
VSVREEERLLPRVLEPEAMDTFEEAQAYDAMDHSEVNARFVADFLAARGSARGGTILDLGTGTARIPIALCRADDKAQVLGVDVAAAMLEQARRNVEQAGLSDRIRCETADGKRLPFDEQLFEAVISNTIIHHIPGPGPVFVEMIRVVQPGGIVFVRDLCRPPSAAEVDRLVALHAGAEAPAAQALFRASLHAALTLDEVRGLIARLGISRDAVALTSDRHWSLVWRKPF